MRLRIFISPTGVGLGYGLLLIGKAFLGTCFRKISLALAAPLALSTAIIRPHMRPLSLRRHRNINLLAIAYALRPRLRSRLTLGRRTLPRKPWVYGGEEFHLPYRYSCLHAHFSTLHRQSPSDFNALRTLLYRAQQAVHPELRHTAYRQSFSAQDHSMSKLLRTF